MAWLAHSGSYRTYSAPFGKGSLIGFAENKQATTDLSCYCYCYRNTIYDPIFLKIYPALWVIVRTGVPWNEIGYMNFSLDNSRFYYHQSPIQFHESLDSNDEKMSAEWYLMGTSVYDSSTPSGRTAYLIANRNGYLISREREDGIRIGAGAWEVQDPDDKLKQDFPTHFGADSLSNWNFTLSCNPIGSYETDPQLSGQHPTITPHFDFAYKKYGTGYTDDFPALSGNYPDGNYYHCFTDSPVVRKVGDRIYAGYRGAHDLSNAIYVWEGGLLDDSGHKVFYVGQYLFPEMNINDVPYDVYALTWNAAANEYRYIGAFGSYISWTQNGNSGTLKYVFNGDEQWSVSMNFYKRGIPTNYRFNMLHLHLNDPHKEFLEGDQFAINI